MTTTPEQIADLISGYTDLKQYFENVRDDVEQRVAAKEAAVDQFLQDATPETRYVQDFTIGGSIDFLYPVWFVFPSNERGVSRLTVARHYNWNGSTDERPLNPNSDHQASLLVELEGNGHSRGGDAKFMEIKRFAWGYNETVSHVSYIGYSKYEDTGTGNYFNFPEHTLGAYSRYRSTVYLRGGGLTYRIIKNWTGDIDYSDSGQRVDIYMNNYGTWYVDAIPFTDILAPQATVNAFVDP